MADRRDYDIRSTAEARAMKLWNQSKIYRVIVAEHLIFLMLCALRLARSVLIGTCSTNAAECDVGSITRTLQ